MFRPNTELYSTVFLLTGGQNLERKLKPGVLPLRFSGNFEYAGNAGAGLVAWRGCRGAVIIKAGFVVPALQGSHARG